MFDFDFWFCCLHPDERAVLRATSAALILTLGVGMPLDLWLTVWAVFPLTGGARRAAFLEIYYLEIVTIMEGEPPVPVDVVRPTDASFWLALSVYLLLPNAACLGGCTQSINPAP